MLYRGKSNTFVTVQYTLYDGVQVCHEDKGSVVPGDHEGGEADQGDKQVVEDDQRLVHTEPEHYDTLIHHPSCSLTYTPSCYSPFNHAPHLLTHILPFLTYALHHITCSNLSHPFSYPSHMHMFFPFSHMLFPFSHMLFPFSHMLFPF